MTFLNTEATISSSLTKSTTSTKSSPTTLAVTSLSIAFEAEKSTDTCMVPSRWSQPKAKECTVTLPTALNSRETRSESWLRSVPSQTWRTPTKSPWRSWSCRPGVATSSLRTCWPRETSSSATRAMSTCRRLGSTTLWLSMERRPDCTRWWTSCKETTSTWCHESQEPTTFKGQLASISI